MEKTNQKLVTKDKNKKNTGFRYERCKACGVGMNSKKYKELFKLYGECPGCLNFLPKKHHDHPNSRWFIILSEEFGEVARNINIQQRKGHCSREAQENLEYELLQVMATCKMWLEKLRKEETKDNKIPEPTYILDEFEELKRLDFYSKKVKDFFNKLGESGK